MQPTRERVLCVADDGQDHVSISSLFCRSIYDVTTAPTAAVALSLAKSERFELYLLASKLPNGANVDLCARIREFDPETPILLLLDSLDEAEWSRLEAAGASGYMMRHVGLDNLVDHVSELIKRSDDPLRPS